MDRQGYYEGFYSLLDSEKELQFHRYESRPELIENAMDLWQIRRLQWFTQGFYAVSKEGQNIVITDLRMGMEPFYIFRFAVAAVEEGRIEAIVSRRIPIQPRLEQIRWVWQRIWQQDMEPVFTSETPRDASVTSGSSLTPKAEARFSSST